MRSPRLAVTGKSLYRDPDDLVMSLVEKARAMPEGERETFVRDECGERSDILQQALQYLDWEQQMGDFLLEPLVPPPQPFEQFAPGSVLLDRFRLLRQLGAGGMGTVWEAFDQKLDSYVALKFPKSGMSRYLPPEVRSAREISHPNVCKIHEIHALRGGGSEHDSVDADFISMEYVEGESLSTRLLRGPLTHEERLDFALQLCAGIGEAHRKGVIHRDLKSGNVMVGKGPGGATRLVVMDFGLAYLAEANTTWAGRIAGTPDYMAPELWKGAVPSVESDLYALGVVFWELLSNKRPEALGLTSSTLAWEERPAWKAPTGFGRWDAVLMRCLQPDPTLRFHSAEEIAKELRPSVARRWILASAAAAALLAIGSAYVTNHLAHAPAETVSMALEPFPAPIQKLQATTATKLGGIQGNAHTAFRFVNGKKGSHVLRTSAEPAGKDLTVHASVSDSSSGVTLTDWTATYRPGELHYLPTALTGVVTEALHLPVAVHTKVNGRALSDYQAGLAALRRSNAIQEALRAAEIAVTKDPDSPLPYAELAEVRWRQSRPGLASPDALKECEQALAAAEMRNPDVSEVHRMKGLLEARVGQYTSAIAEYQRAIELDPANGDAYRRLGMTYESNNQLDIALAMLREAVRRDPFQVANQQDLSFLCTKRGLYEEAIEHARKAMTLAPDNAEIHLSLSNLLTSAGPLPQAEAEARRAIELRESGFARHQLGVVLLREQKEREASLEIARAVELGPERCLWWMNLGTAHRRSGRLSDSKAAYSHALQLGEVDLASNPRDAKTRAHLAYLCTQLGDINRAESEVAQAVRELPSDPDVLFFVALTYEALGRRDQAVAAVKQSPVEVTKQIITWPDASGLAQDPRFQSLIQFSSSKDKLSGG